MNWWPFNGAAQPSRRRADSIRDEGSRRSRLWLPGLALGLVAVVLILALPPSSKQWDFVFLCTSLLSFVVLLGAALTMPAGVRGIWWSLFAYQVLTIGAQAISNWQAENTIGRVAFPGVPDAISLVAYLPVFVALGVLIHRLNPGRDREAWIDASILSVAAASVFGLFIIVPVLNRPGMDSVDIAVAVAYPILDLAVLSSLIWLLVGGGRPRGSLVLVAASFALSLTADIVRDISFSSSEQAMPTVWLDALRLASLVVLAAAATTPTAERIATPRERPESRASTPRLAVLALGVLAVPSLVVLRLWNDASRLTLLLALAAIIVIILAVWRIKILVSTVEEQRLVTELVLDSAGDGIIGLDRQGFVLFANLSARRMLRCRETDLVGRRFHDVAHHERPDGSPYPWHECPLRELVATGGEGFLSDQMYVRRDGTTFPVEIVMSPLIVEGTVMGAVQSFRDVSEREAMDELKRQFVSVVSHELRTPLTSIKGSLQMLDSGIVGPLTDDQQELVTMAVNNSTRLGQLVNDILDLERLDSGRMPLNPERVNALALVEQAAAGMTGAADAAGIRLTIDDVDDRAPLDVDVDPHRMQQVLTNLMGNAIKFSERGSSIRLTASRTPAGVLMTVEDHGRGIPPDQLATVFDRFGQVDAGDARREGGTGLGLAIVQELVTRSGGRIDVSSTLSVGSVFTVTLPPADADQPVAEVLS
jgi:PAS domain S-box-containing protein